MIPRTATDPDRIGTSDEAISELTRCGDLQRYKPGMSDAAIFLQKQARVSGLPEDWEDCGVVTVEVGGRKIDWRIYLETASGIRMGFAESLDGRALRLLLLIPTDQIFQRDAVAEIRKRT